MTCSEDMTFERSSSGLTEGNDLVGEFEMQMVDTLSRVESIMANVQSLINRQSIENKALLKKEVEAAPTIKRVRSDSMSSTDSFILNLENKSVQGSQDQEDNLRIAVERIAELENILMQREDKERELRDAVEELQTQLSTNKIKLALDENITEKNVNILKEVTKKVKTTTSNNTNKPSSRSSTPTPIPATPIMSHRKDSVKDRILTPSSKSTPSNKVSNKATYSTITQEKVNETKIQTMEKFIQCDISVDENSPLGETAAMRKILSLQADIDEQRINFQQQQQNINITTQELEKCINELKEQLNSKEDEVNKLKEEINKVTQRLRTEYEQEIFRIKEELSREKETVLAQHIQEKEKELKEEKEKQIQERKDIEEERQKLSQQYMRDSELHQRELNEVKAASQKQIEMLQSMKYLITKNEEALNAKDIKIEQMSKALEEAIDKYKHEVAERRAIFNMLQEARGNIRVLCRVRPLVAFCDSSSSSMSATFGDQGPNGELTEIRLQESKDGAQGKYTKQHAFEFDKVFSPELGQTEVFCEVQPIVTSILDGYNACIFAYGQTGSGKTYTMGGTPTEPGINQRTLEALFSLIEHRKETWQYKVSVSVMEIYNENVFDLLVPDARDVREKKLEIRLTRQNNVMIPDAKLVIVQSAADVLKILERGQQNRAVGQTDANEHSSRSHCLLTVYVEGENMIAKERLFGKLHLIDLAGSEKLSKSHATGDRMVESVSINKTLSALGDVMHSLAKKEKHVPYRNSQLTFLLQDSLGGDSKVVMIVTISPSTSNVVESINSLNFASRVRKVELGKAKKHVVKIQD